MNTNSEEKKKKIFKFLKHDTGTFFYHELRLCKWVPMKKSKDALKEKIPENETEEQQKGCCFLAEKYFHIDK